MKQIIRLLNLTVLISTTTLIALIFYKGIGEKSYDVAIGIVVSVMDFGFIISTVLNLFYFKKDKYIIGWTILSTILIVIGLVLKVLGIPYSPVSLLFWNFYLMYWYGYLVMTKQWKRMSIN